MFDFSTGAREPRLSRARVSAAVVVAILSVPLVVVGIAGRWATGTLLDNSAVSSTTATILAEPAVVSAMGDFLGEELMSLYEENFDVSSKLPESLQDEGKVIKAALQEELKSQATTLVGSGAVQDLLSQLVTGFHSQLVSALEPDADAAPSGVTLNLVPVATELMRGLQDKGLLPGDMEIPVIDLELPPAAQVSALSEALKIELPEELGSVEVFSADEVATDSKELSDARRAVSTVKLVSWLALGVSAVLLVALWFIVGSRRAASIMIGAVLLAAGAVGLALAVRAPDLVASGIEDALAQEALRVTISDLGSGLRTSNVVTSLLGALIIAGALWGPAMSRRIRSARRARTAI